MIVFSVLCGLLAAGLVWALHEVQQKRKIERVYKELTDRQDGLIKRQEQELSEMRNEIMDIELYPCRILFLTVYFEQESSWQVVDMSKYKEAGVISVTVGLEREPNEKEILAGVPSKAVPIPHGAVCIMGDKVLWSVQ